MPYLASIGTYLPGWGAPGHRVAGDDEDAQSDGAAALVLAAEDVVDRFTDRPVWIRGLGLGLDSVTHQHKPDMATFPATTRAA
ncbi:MAG TPA: hypothetical protein VN959_18485, partial [Mycobacterium sp.]|nr:hypothetical protein [Mycobacterium sp.]